MNNVNYDYEYHHRPRMRYEWSTPEILDSVFSVLAWLAITAGGMLLLLISH